MKNLTDALMTPAAGPATPEDGGNFSQGLRQGMTAAGGQLHALAGGVGEYVGAKDFAANQYAQAKEAEQLAATQAPEINDWRQVTNAPDLTTGLRNAGGYIAGLAGQSLPMVGLGLGAGAATALSGGGAGAALLAGTAAVAPFETGGALERQQADPAVLQKSAGERLGTAALEGTGRALAMNAVPQLMGGKLVGRALAGGVPAAVAEGVGGNALAGAAAEKISSTAQDSLNPNRDTSGDDARMLDAAVAGGALGVPFAGMGIAGHMIHGEGKATAPAADAAPAAPAAPKPSLADKIRGAFTKDDGADAAEKIAAGKDVIDTKALASAPPDQQVQMLRDADAQRVETTRGWAQELMQDGKLSDENKVALQQATQDLSSRASQAIVAGMKLAQDGAAKATDIATSFMDAVMPKKDGAQADAGREVQKSEVSSGTHQAIADVVTPHIAARFPALADSSTGMQSITRGLSTMMQKMQDTGRVNADAASQLQKLFGRDTTRVLTELHDQVLDTRNPDKVDNYFRAVNQLDTNASARGRLVDMMRGALPEDVPASNDQLHAMADHLREYVSGATLDGKTPEQARAHANLIESALNDHFGDKANDILEAARVGLEMEREKESQDAQGARDESELPEDHIDYAGNSDDGLADHLDAGVTTEQDLAREYFGAGKDKTRPQFMLSEQAHRDTYGNEDSQAARVLRDVAAKNPDKNVSVITAREYARENGMPVSELGKNIDPDKHVMIKAEGMKREGLSWQDVEGARLDTHRYPDSKSRIDTEDGPTFDAVKVMKMYAQEHKLARDDMDAQNPFYRLRRQFTEAVGALSDHIGEAIDVHDTTVVARRGGRDITWGELQKLGAAKPDERARQMSALYGEREAAVKAGDADSVARLDAQIDKHTSYRGDEEDTTRGSEKLAEIAKQLGGARQKVEQEIVKTGALRGADGKTRPLTMRERALVREHDKLIDKYNREAENVKAKQLSPFDAAKEAGGVSEISPDAQVHVAEREHGDKLTGAFAGQRNMEAGPEGNLLHADNFSRTEIGAKQLPASIRGAIDSRVQGLVVGKSAVQRALGAKGQHLVKVADQMRPMDQAELASIVKEKDLSEVGKTINALHAKYGELKAQEPKQSRFVDRVLGKGNVNDVIHAIKVSSDVRGVQRAIDALAPHSSDPSARAVLQAATERMQRIVEGNPEVTYSMQRVDPASTSTSKARVDAAAYIEKVLGKSVDAEFSRMLHAGEFVTDKSRVPQGLAADVIRISTHSLDPMGTAYHESLHAFMAKLSDAKLMDEAHPLVKAANSPRVMNQLKVLLANEPDALKQLDDPHERAAYMFQFWAAGKLKLQGRPEGIMGHVADLFKKTLGIWTNDARAEHIMDYFHSGEYARDMGDRSAVGRVLSEGANETVDKFTGMLKPLGRLGMAVASTGDARLRGTGIDALARLADHVYAPLHGEHGDDPGYLPAARAKRGEFMNRLGEELGRVNKEVLPDVLVALQQGARGKTPAERMAVASVKKVLRDAHDYMTKAGVQLGDLGPDYFPRVWDPQAILRNETAFRDMLGRYKSAGQFKGSVDAVMATLTRSDGSELQAPTIKPGMQASKERVLSFISGRDAEPFLNKNLFETLNGYMTQATRRAEWAQRFGDDNARLHDLFDEARHQGATPEHLQLASDYLQGVDGTLGDKIDPKLRRAFGNAIVYQNLRLLPLAIFSSMIDPMGILVRGGTLRDSFSAMKRGFAEMPKNFKKDAKNDSWTDLAAHLGVIDNAVLQHNLGTSFSQGMTSNLGRKLNDAFFKYNLMEQYNTSMRVAATQSAVGFLARHAAGDASPHSARWLAELGYKPGEIKMGKDGQPLIKASEFEASGMKPADAQAAADKMTLAINKWVDGAILRPNAAHKPIWMNDPHFAVMAHLKQFVYSFQETIMKRVGNEVMHGNVGPAYALAAYVPFMLAADSIKGMVQGGGDQPDWKKGWDAGDYLAYEVQRAGLFGVGQFAVDAAKDLHRGGLGVGALVGPTVEQLGEAVKTISGPEQFKTFALNALPANALFDAAGAATASTNAID